MHARIHPHTYTQTHTHTHIGELRFPPPGDTYTCTHTSPPPPPTLPTHIQNWQLGASAHTFWLDVERLRRLTTEAAMPEEPLVRLLTAAASSSALSSRARTDINPCTRAHPRHATKDLVHSLPSTCQTRGPQYSIELCELSQGILVRMQLRSLIRCSPLICAGPLASPMESIWPQWRAFRGLHKKTPNHGSCVMQ